MAEIKPTLRPDRVLDLRDYIKTAIEAYESELVRSCLTCLSFKESAELCAKFNARPPARVIAYGCKDYYNENEIPF